MLTEFGKFCRKLRIDRGELLKHMADKLEVSSAYLSSVEIGRRNIPKQWPDLIADIYSLNDCQRKSLKKASEDSKMKINMDLTKFSSGDKNLVLSFARKFDSLDADAKEKIRIALDSK